MADRRRVPRERREQQILDVATRAFAEHGFADVSMEQIAGEVGITKPLIYAYFGSKDGLFDACATRAWRAMGEQIFEAASRPARHDVQLWRGIVAYFDFIDTHRNLWRIVYPEVSRGGERAGEELRVARRGAVELMASLFTRAAGEADADPELAAQMTVPFAYAFVGAATAIAGWWLEHPEEPKDLQALRLMNFAWMGLGNLLEEKLWIPPEEDPAP